MEPEVLGRTILEKSRDVLWRSLDPANCPFPDAIAHRLLIYPTSGSMLTEEQFRSVSQCAVNLGECQLLVVTVGDNSSFSTRSIEEAFVFDASQYDEYANRREVRGYQWTNNVVLGLSGKWCILVSDLGFAIAGGDAKFVRCLSLSGALSPTEMALGFVESQRRLSRRTGSNDEWVSCLVRHILGPHDAERLIADLDEDTDG